MKTLLLLTLLSVNNPISVNNLKDTTTTCIKKKSCCKHKLNDSFKYCVGLISNDTTKTEKKHTNKNKKNIK